MKKQLSTMLFTLILASLFMVAPASAKTAASDVVDKETLKSFVTNAKDRIGQASTASEIFAVLREFRDDKAWNDGAIYVFIMQRPSGPQGGEIVVFNAHNPSLEGATLHVVDGDGKDVGHEIDRAVYQGDGFVEYRWDNPSFSGDEVREEGRATGTSRKIVYGVNVKLFGNEDFVLGSGFYPDPPPVSSDKKGCSVATTEAGNASQSAIFNLLLVVSSVFFLVSWKNSTEEK